MNNLILNQEMVYARIKHIKKITDVKIAMMLDSALTLEKDKDNFSVGEMQAYVEQEILQLKEIAKLRKKYDEDKNLSDYQQEDFKNRIKALKGVILNVIAYLK